MSFATEFFDSGNTTIGMTKDYINCERTYFIIFNDDRLVHADSRQRSTMLQCYGYVKWRRSAVPFPNVAKAFFDGDDERNFCGV